jgi:tetratricopeptide (TPR) repeat protein
MSSALSNALSSQLEQISKHPDDPATLQTMHEAASALQATNNHTAAKELFNLTWQRQSAILGPSDPATLNSLYHRGLAEVNLGQFAEAEQTYRQMKLLYENMPKTDLGVLSNLAYILNIRKQYPEAEAIARDVLQRIQERLGEASEQALGNIRTMVEALAGQGRYQEARGFLDRGFKLLEGVTADYREEEIRCMREVERLVEGH